MNNYHQSSGGNAWIARIVIFIIGLAAIFYGPAQAQSSGLPTCSAPGGATFVGGVVPDATTARLIAEGILRKIYGNRLISQQIPLSVDFKDDKYFINGVRKNTSIGGHATIVLCKSNSAVVFMSHSK